MQKHPLIQTFTMQLASELESDRREFRADLMEAMMKAMSG